MTTLAGCSWSVGNNSSWIQITSGGSGIGSGTVNYSLLSNPSLSARTGDLVVGGQTFQITQAGLTCQFAISPFDRTHGVGLESGSISVTTSNVCTWMTVNSNTWITINSGASGAAMER